MTNRLFMAALAGFASLTLPTAIPTASAQVAAQQGPNGLIIQYQADREDRAAFRTYLTDVLAPRLRQMQKQGKLEAFRIYYSWYRQPGVWDGMVTLRFKDFEAVTAWNELEKAMPGGLDKQGLALADPTLTSSVDLTFSKKPDLLRDGQVFYVIPYEYNNLEQYQQYVQEYVLPQFDGWMDRGAIDGYEIFFNEYQVGRPWDALFIQHYHDMKAFGARHPVKADVRVGLADNAVWKAWSENKGDIRSETENTIAELIAH